jgi:Ca2+-binding RTX toxin-like protein
MNENSSQAERGTASSNLPSITFLGGTAGFMNTVGTYKIAEDGSIYDVQILFESAANIDNGGQLIPGETKVELDVSVGDQVGVFILPDAYNLNADKSVFNSDRYELRDWGGSAGNVFDDVALRLFAINDTTGEDALVDARWNAATWHMNHSPEAGVGMNSDGVDHVRGQREYDNSVTVGFSDVYGGGGSHDSVLLNINLGDSGAYMLDDEVFNSTDHTGHSWIAPVEIQEGLPEVPFAVLPQTGPLALVGEEDFANDADEVAPTVTFMGESAGYQNTFGMYKIADDGTIYDIDIVFANASRAGSGGNLIAGQSAVEIGADPGDNLGFFILSDGYRQNADKSVFDADSYTFRDWGGGVGNIYWSTGLRLFAVDDAKGQETLVNARFNAATWHMHHKPEDGVDMNVDNFDHLRGQLKYDGSVTVGFEDIMNGGDRDFNDVMFNINLGDSGARIEDEGIFSGSDQHEAGFFTEDGEATRAKVTFLSETADYKNTVGMYRIAKDGTIQDIQIIFSNASKYGGGGDLIPGESSVDIDVDSGENLGFFIIPDGYTYNSDKSLFEEGTFVFRNSAGVMANVYHDQDLKLFRSDPETNTETLLHGRYDNATYHLTYDAAQGISLNADGKDHALGEARAGHKVTIGFEDIENNGDWDFDDVVIEVELSTTGASIADPNLKTEEDADQSKIGWLFEANDEIFDHQPWLGENNRLYADRDAQQIDGQAGDDLVYGDRFANILIGNDGFDVLLGHEGDDELSGGPGDDHLNGGVGSDLLKGGDGSDFLWGQLGVDILEGGSGDDRLWGGSGSDNISGGIGEDRLFGNSGADILSGDGGADILYGGAGSDTFLFAAGDLDGTIDVIADFEMTGDAQDLIDLRALNLLSADQTKAEWLALNALVNAQDVHLNLGGGTLVIGGAGLLGKSLHDLEDGLIL